MGGKNAFTEVSKIKTDISNQTTNHMVLMLPFS